MRSLESGLSFVLVVGVLLSATLVATVSPVSAVDAGTQASEQPGQEIASCDDGSELVTVLDEQIVEPVEENDSTCEPQEIVNQQNDTEEIVDDEVVEEVDQPPQHPKGEPNPETVAGTSDEIAPQVLGAQSTSSPQVLAKTGASQIIVSLSGTFIMLGALSSTVFSRENY